MSMLLPKSLKYKSIEALIVNGILISGRLSKSMLQISSSMRSLTLISGNFHTSSLTKVTRFAVIMLLFAELLLGIRALPLSHI